MPTPPTFDGQPIFGRKITLRVEPEPRASQTFETFGADGKYQLDGGARGTKIHIGGELAASTPAGLALAQIRIRAASLGQAAPFTDPTGRTWAQCLLSEFTPTGRVSNRPGSAEWCQRYTLQVLSIGAEP